jgi:hypothetical protein
MGTNLVKMQLKEYVKEIFDKNYEKKIHKKITQQCAEFKQGLRVINQAKHENAERLKKEREKKAKAGHSHHEHVGKDGKIEVHDEHHKAITIENKHEHVGHNHDHAADHNDKK